MHTLATNTIQWFEYHTKYFVLETSAVELKSDILITAHNNNKMQRSDCLSQNVYVVLTLTIFLLPILLIELKSWYYTSLMSLTLISNWQISAIILGRSSYVKYTRLVRTYSISVLIHVAIPSGI